MNLCAACSVSYIDETTHFCSATCDEDRAIKLAQAGLWRCGDNCASFGLVDNFVDRTSQLCQTTCTYYNSSNSYCEALSTEFCPFFNEPSQKECTLECT